MEALRSSGADGDLLLGYPVLASVEGPRAVDATFLGRGSGVVLFDLVEDEHTENIETRQDDLANRITARLLTDRRLVKRRRLEVPVVPATFHPRAGEAELGDYPILTPDAISRWLADLEWPEETDDLYRATLSALQSMASVRSSRRARSTTTESSRGSRLNRLENSIATLDMRQSRAVIETADDVQRIRGLAGSGKTIVLALKAAYLHAQRPEWKLAVTFNTRSLKGHFKRLITGFSLEQRGEEPDWTRLRIINAWGAPGGPDRAGIYFEFCDNLGLEYLNFGGAKRRFGFSQAFEGAVGAALAEAASLDVPQMYDAILVDEAQDFPPNFLRMCYQILGQDKRLVYAYDELQDLNGSGLPPAEDLFGNDEFGNPRVTFGLGDERPSRDIVLERCYRNSRPVLTSAHALGFGIYREEQPTETTNLVQMFDRPQLWSEIGYEPVDGYLAPGRDVTLRRTSWSSPPFLEQHSDTEDILSIHEFMTQHEQDEWVASSIETNLYSEDLDHRDIVVINPDPLTTKDNLAGIRKILFQRGIQTHLAGVDADPDIFFMEDYESVTFTGVHRAKGNEAGMVYLVNSNESYDAYTSLASVRNRLFTAMTRSKAWVRVCGVGPDMEALAQELREVAARDFALAFRYPTEQERQALQIVHRDVSREDERLIKDREQSLAGLLEDLAAGRIYVEDLDPAVRRELLERLTDG